MEMTRAHSKLLTDPLCNPRVFNIYNIHSAVGQV